jgi:flagellin
MALGINTNVASLSAQNQLSSSQRLNDQALERLSSGLRINSAKDDAAGLAISTRFQSQISGLGVAQRNANDGISLAQTAEGALGEVVNNLQRIRDLAVQSANATNSNSDREALQAEVSQLVSEIDRVATQTEFNGIKIVDGSFTAKAFQVGANAGQTITVDSIASARSSDLGQFTGFSLTDQSIGAADDAANAQSVSVGGQSYDLGTIANDAKAIAAALNNAGITGLNVTANENTLAGTTQTDGSEVTANGNSTLTLNGIDIDIATTSNASSNRSNALAAINAQSSVTGVRAVDNGGTLDLVAADGRNITTSFAEGGATGALLETYGLNDTAGTYGATLDVEYKAPAGVTGNFTFTGAFDPGAQAIAATGTALNAIDIGTVGGANTAITSIDAALDSINSARADLGAVQNRFESTIANIATTSENLSASNSRILDADFAAETAKLSKSQVLQQAGISVLAQANARPQQVLSLLQ